MKREDLSKRIANLWYYYKWYLLGGLLLICALAIAIQSCQKRQNADLFVLYARDTSPDALQVQELENWFGGMTEDVNGDGEPTAQVLATATTDQWTGANSSAMLVQVNSGSAVLYLLSEANYETLHNNGMLMDLSALGLQSPYLEKDRFDLSQSGKLSGIAGFSMESGSYYLCIRKVEGTTFEGKTNYETQLELAEKMLKTLTA